MKPEHLDIIKLLRSGITGEKLALSPDFSIEKAQSVLKHHGVQAMGYMGAVNCGVARNDPAMQTLFTAYRQSMIISQHQLTSAQKLFSCFEENGIDYLPLKGLIMKHLYPYPELRPMGDGDILIRVEQYPQIRQVMLSLGYQEKQESDHELPWVSAGLYVELHKRLTPSADADLFRYYGDGWKFAKPLSGSRYEMSDEDFFVYLFAHFAKHYRGGGIGCRHVVDLWVYRMKHPGMDESYIQSQLKVLGLDVFYGYILSVLDAWFSDLPFDERSALITRRIFENGVWGTAENLYISENLRSAADSGSLKSGKWKLIIRRIFPDYEQMKYRYPGLKGKRILLPVFWVVRIFDLLFHKSHVTQKRFSMLSKKADDRILQRKQELEYVGLSLDFEPETDV